MIARVVTQRQRATRRRGDGPQPPAALARGVAVVAVLALLTALAVRAYDGVPLRAYRTLHVTVPAVGNLRTHDPVRIAGVRAGQVASLRIAADGSARVRLQLEPDAPPLPADTRVAVRAAGLLGARYVELLPGRSGRTLADGATIRAGRAALTFGVPELLDTFDRDTRGRVGDLIDATGAGMFARGDELNDAIRAGAAGQRPFQALAERILARRGAARRLLPALNRAAGALDGAGTDLAALFRPAARSLAPFGDRRRALAAALDRAPGALAAAQIGLERGRRLLGATRALAAATRATLPPAPAGLRAATRLLRSGRTPLARATGLLRQARPASTAALRLTAALAPVLAPLRQGLDSATPIVTEVGRYGCDIRNLGAVFRSMTGIGSLPGGQVGALTELRLQITASPFELSGTQTPEAVRVRDPYAPPCRYLGRRYPVLYTPGARR